MSTSPSIVLDPPRLSTDRAARLVWRGRVLALAGVLACVGAALVDPRRFAFSYLAGFTFAVTLALGALIFIILQHLTRAGWSVGPRRQMEWLASGLPVLAILFVPVALLSGHLYAWMHPGEEHALHGKAPFLNAPFFFVRAAVYLAVWALLARFFSRASRAQDESGEPALTRRMQTASAPAALLFGLTVTFAGFDWLMSLQPLWYSTIFGVYVFAGAIVSALAVLALFTLALQRWGGAKAVTTVEHRHDIGKLLFGFVVFYAYISFSQYFLIWYANIPEETIFYGQRWVGGWKTLSVALILLHFVLPFALLLSRAGKRSPRVLGVAAASVLVGHYLDLYWLVLPILDGGAAGPSLIDLAGLLGPVGVLAWWVTGRVANEPLYPVRDPRLREAVRLENA